VAASPAQPAPPAPSRPAPSAGCADRWQVLRYLEEYSGAAESFRKAVDLDPSLPGAEALQDMQSRVKRTAELVEKKVSQGKRSCLGSAGQDCGGQAEVVRLRCVLWFTQGRMKEKRLAQLVAPLAEVKSKKEEYQMSTIASLGWVPLGTGAG
jgi:hypothetical protein